MEVLTSEQYREVLALQRTVTLVDARNLADERYTYHETFNQQIAMADVVIGNKRDLYHIQDKAVLHEYVQQIGQPHAEILYTQFGEIDPLILSGVRGSAIDEQSHHGHSHDHHHGETKPLASELPLPESGVIKAENSGEGYQSIGWRFAPEKVFNYQQLISLLRRLQVERMKAVFITDEGQFGYNFTPDNIQEVALDDIEESRIELISKTVDDELELQLLACVKQIMSV